MRACLRGVKKNWHWIFFGFVALLTVGMDVTQDIYSTTKLRPLDIATVFSLFFCFTNGRPLARL
ncbi:MAG: hypothetical protein MR842_08155 [Clostridiales bacterium]|nr:hypothetical protein [Clostridiales bacterium]MDO4351053.1 hypothetical protein [Eubacteriales bacterium]MDY4007606.1 hypothetical protein [Candidatus Limiplasma sp.]